MSYRTDKQRVIGLGSAKDGTDHWWSQRLNAIALVPLTLLFIFPFARNLGADFETVRATYSNPFHAIVALLLIIVVFTHLRQGLQVVIEDYVHSEGLKLASIIAVRFIAVFFGLAATVAILRIGFGG